MKTPTTEEVTAALGAGVKGAMAGMALGPFGALAGGLIAIASDLVPGAVLSDAAKPQLASAATAITGQDTETAQVAALQKDPIAAGQFRVEVLKIAADAQAARDATNLQIQQMLLEQQKVGIADTANARAQTVQLAQAGSSLAWGAPVMSAIVLVAFAILATTVVVHAVPETNRDIANIMLGTLGAMATNVVAYYVGSSAGSAVKTQLLARSVPASLLPDPAAVVPASDVRPGNLY